MRITHNSPLILLTYRGNISIREQLHSEGEVSACKVAGSYMEKQKPLTVIMLFLYSTTSRIISRIFFLIPSFNCIF